MKAKVVIEKLTSNWFEGYVEAHTLPQAFQDLYPGEEYIEVTGDYYLDWKGDYAFPEIEGAVWAYKDNRNIDLNRDVLDYDALKQAIEDDCRFIGLLENKNRVY